MSWLRVAGHATLPTAFKLL